MESKASRFKGNYQNDSLDFLTCLLAEMHKELTTSKKADCTDWSEKIDLAEKLDENFQVWTAKIRCFILNTLSSF
jgi:hypothetical protein